MDPLPLVLSSIKDMSPVDVSQLSCTFLTTVHCLQPHVHQQNGSLTDHRLSVNKVLDSLQPIDILLLLLDIGVIRHKRGQGGVDPSGLEVVVENTLQLLVQRIEHRARVDGLGGVAKLLQGICRGRGKMCDPLDSEVAVIRQKIDVE